MAHATHPNYADRHEPLHQIRVNGGPVLKVNTNLRYATDAVGAARVPRSPASRPASRCSTSSRAATCRAARPSARSPSSLTGATTVDFGAAALSMHSTRELMGAQDPAMYAGALSAFLAPA